MPGRDQLPKNLEAITWQNSKKLSNDYWQTDIERLIKSIREYLRLPEVKERTTAPPVQKTVRKAVTPPPKKSSNSGVFKGVALGVLGLLILLIGIGIAFSLEDTPTVRKITKEDFPSFTGYVDATKLNVRSEPGTSGTDIITQLEQNNVVSVINEKNHDGKAWYQINVNGKEGWVSSDYISETKVVKNSEKNQTQLSQTQRSSRLAATPTPPPVRPQDQPVTTYTYQQLAMGSWNLARLSYNGESLSVADFMTVLMNGELYIQSANLSYYMDGSTNTITSSIDGIQMETVTYNYQINGTTFTMSNGTIANIDLLTQQKMNITINAFDGFSNGSLTFFFVRI